MPLRRHFLPFRNVWNLLMSSTELTKKTWYLEAFHLHDKWVLLGAQRLKRRLFLYQTLGQSSQSVLQLLLIGRIHRLGNQLPPITRHTLQLQTPHSLQQGLCPVITQCTLNKLIDQGAGKYLSLILAQLFVSKICYWWAERWCAEGP